MKYSLFRLSLLSVAAALLTFSYLPINAAENSNYQKTDVSEIISAAEAGDAEAQSRMGFLLTEGKSVTRNYSAAIVWLRKAADQGSMSGQYNLACAYLNGSGVKEDTTEALRWFMKAAEQGSPHAEFQIGLIYEDDGDFREAAKWYLRSAEKGNTDAQVMLGGLYVDGKGVAKSYSEAEKWFVKASRDGDQMATVEWGMLYLDGDGKYNNISYGMTIIRQAASEGNSFAQQFLADQSKSMSNVGNNNTIQEVPKTRAVSKSERSKINQAIFRSGLSRSLYAARQLSDEEALRLYPDALQILDAKGTQATNPNPKQSSTGASGVTPDAYGLGVNSDQYGRAHTYKSQDGKALSPIFQKDVERDAYGLGVHSDPFGRPVYDSTK